MDSEMSASQVNWTVHTDKPQRMVPKVRAYPEWVDTTRGLLDIARIARGG